MLVVFNFNFYVTLQKENDKDHKVRLAIGNGVRAEIWREFVNRFGNIQIREFYASTEGNVGFVNYAGKIGAIGRVNFFHKVRMRLKQTYVSVNIVPAITDSQFISVYVGITHVIYWNAMVVCQ